MMTENIYNGCKLKVFNTVMCGDMEGYEKAVSDFLSQHNIVKVFPTQSSYMHSIHIFYKDGEKD